MSVCVWERERNYKTYVLHVEYGTLKEGETKVEKDKRYFFRKRFRQTHSTTQTGRQTERTARKDAYKKRGYKEKTGRERGSSKTE